MDNTSHGIKEQKYLLSIGLKALLKMRVECWKRNPFLADMKQIVCFPLWKKLAIITKNNQIAKSIRRAESLRNFFRRAQMHNIGWYVKSSFLIEMKVICWIFAGQQTADELPNDSQRKRSVNHDKTNSHSFWMRFETLNISHFLNAKLLFMYDCPNRY